MFHELQKNKITTELFNTKINMSIVAVRSSSGSSSYIR